jgi:hypothetical protein
MARVVRIAAESAVKAHIGRDFPAKYLLIDK